MTTSILILCSDGPHHGYLVRELSSRFKVTGVFCETEKAQRRKLLRRGRHVDYAWRWYHGLRRWCLGLDRFRREFFGGSFHALVEGTVPVMMVEDINDTVVVGHIAEAGPAAIVVMGTSILKEPLLRAGIPTINIHGGYLPDYKGNHCIFFAYYDNCLEKVGATIHLVDAGVDSGAIVERVTVSVGPDDVPESSYCKAEMKAVTRLAEILERFGRVGELPIQPQAPVGRTYRTRDRTPLHDVLLWWRLGRLRPRISPAPDSEPVNNYIIPPFL